MALSSPWWVVVVAMLAMVVVVMVVVVVVAAAVLVLVLVVLMVLAVLVVMMVVVRLDLGVRCGSRIAWCWYCNRPRRPRHQVNGHSQLVAHLSVGQQKRHSGE